MSFAHPSWSPVESTDRPMILTPRRSNSGLIFAMYPSSVVHTGVKSFGCEKSTAQESPIQSWKLIGPSVVSAWKSGAVSLICSAIVLLPFVRGPAARGASAYLTRSNASVFHVLPLLEAVGLEQAEPD